VYCIVPNIRIVCIKMDGKVELLDNARLTAQLKTLDRKTRQAGRDLIMNFHGHDDLANSAAGAIVAATVTIGDWPLARLAVRLGSLDKEDRFDNLSPEDQKQVEMYKSHKWLLDDKSFNMPYKKHENDTSVITVSIRPKLSIK